MEEMKLAVTSDSHHAIGKLEKLFGFLKQEKIRHLVHAGDMVTEGVASLISRYPEINCYIAVGNCDYGETIETLRSLPHVMIDSVVHFELEGRHFAVSHMEGLAQRKSTGRVVDVFFHGHTHRTRIDDHLHPMIVNPGSLMDGHGFLLLDVPSLKFDRRFKFE